MLALFDRRRRSGSRPGRVSRCRGPDRLLQGQRGRSRSHGRPLLAHGPRLRQRPHQLTSDPGDDTPSYSANGRSCSPESRSAPDQRLPHLCDERGRSSVRQVTSGDGYDSDPSFSPEGAQIVFDRASGSGRVSRIFIVNVDRAAFAADRRLQERLRTHLHPQRPPHRLRRQPRHRRPHRSSDIFAMAPDGATSGC